MSTKDANEHRTAKDAARYKKNIANGMQEVYVTNQRNRRWAAKVHSLLPKSKRHLFGPVMWKLSHMPKWNKASEWQIQIFIEECDIAYERSLAALASARSDDDAVSSTNATTCSTATRTKDTPSQAPANHDAATGQSTSPIDSKDASNATTAMTATAAPADGAALITPDKPGDQTNDGTCSDPSGDTSTSYLSDDDFVHFSDADDNPNSVCASSIESESDSESDKDHAPKPAKKRRLTREVDALVRSRPGSLPLDGNDWNEPVQTMALWKAYGLDKAPQQATSISLHNAGQLPFYKDGTGISRIDLCFVPPNTRFPNDVAMDEAAIAARTLVADEFGGDELLDQRDRGYSAPNFHTAFYMDRTCAACPAVHGQGINDSCKNYFPTNKCISVAYFTKLESSDSGSACMWIEWLVTAKDYRNRKLGIGKLLMKNILHLALIDEGVDGVYLEVGSGNSDWEAARHVYSSVGFDVLSDLSTVPKPVEEQCKHFGDNKYDILHFDCEKNANMFDNE